MMACGFQKRPPAAAAACEVKPPRETPSSVSFFWQAITFARFAFARREDYRWKVHALSFLLMYRLSIATFVLEDLR